MSYGQFHFDVGDLVQLVWDASVHSIRWRGWVHMRRGAVNQRPAVYWLSHYRWENAAPYFERA
jgi:hypothetical protein